MFTGTIVRVQHHLSLMPKSAAAPHLAPPPPHRHSLRPARPYALDDGGDTNLDNNDDAVAVADQAAQAEEAQAQAEAAGERLKGIVRIRGGGCAASKPRAQAEPFIPDLEGPSGSSSPLAVEQGPEAVPEDMNVAEPGPETIDTMPTEVVEPAAGAAMEAEAALAEAAADTKNPMVEIGNSIIDAIVLAFTPRAGLFSSGPSNGPTQPNALEDGDDNNLDDDDVRPTVAMSPIPEIIRVLSGLDDRLADVLRAGDIKLLRVSWLRRLRRGVLRAPAHRNPRL